MSNYPIFTQEQLDPLKRKLYESYASYFERLIELSAEERERCWHRDYTSVDAYLSSVRENRARFCEMIGGWHWERGDLKPRVERVAETETFTIDRVFLTVFDDVEIDCLLLIPPGANKCPGVLAQHGLNGTPEQACGFVPEEDVPPYNAFGARLAEAGYVVIAPHMVGGYGHKVVGDSHVPGMEGLAQGRARTQLYRKAMLVGQRIMGAEMFALSRVIDYLCSLPEVDASRIGMYGLSQGGQSALWLPALDQRIKATVCAAFFNARAEKMAVISDKYSCYLLSEEEDKFFFGQLQEFSDSDIASLICPRPFFVETGKQDSAVWWRCALDEFEKVKAHYVKLGIPERTDICIHEGGHECRVIESLAFLDRWLKVSLVSD